MEKNDNINHSGESILGMFEQFGSELADTETAHFKRLVTVLLDVRNGNSGSRTAMSEVNQALAAARPLLDRWIKRKKSSFDELVVGILSRLSEANLKGFESLTDAQSAELEELVGGEVRSKLQLVEEGLEMYQLLEAIDPDEFIPFELDFRESFLAAKQQLEKFNAKLAYARMNNEEKNEYRRQRELLVEQFRQQLDDDDMPWVQKKQLLTELRAQAEGEILPEVSAQWYALRMRG